jgi:hypothetical protein
MYQSPKIAGTVIILTMNNLSIGTNKCLQVFAAHQLFQCRSKQAANTFSLGEFMMPCPWLG